MSGSGAWGAQHEQQRQGASRAELAARLSAAARGDALIEPLPGVRVRRVSAPTELGHGVSYPSFCIVAQGAKELRLGGRVYPYDPAHYLIATATLPIASRIVEASPERPYLGMVLRLDPALVGSVMAEVGQPAPRAAALTAVDVSPLDAALLDAALRLARLLEAPGEARYLAPLIVREIIFRLLRGAQAVRLQHIAALASPGHRIAAAIERLRREFDQPLRIEAVARDLGMSVSGFHHHFRALTAMSPLQFQKQLRLQEARRLMLGEGLDAASAGWRVGYSSAAHFTREYKRLFGAPPMRDVERLRQAAPAGAALDEPGD